MGKPSVVLQAHDEDLHRLLHQLLPVVGEEQVVVRDAVAHRVVGTHHIQQRGEQRQRVSAGVSESTEVKLIHLRMFASAPPSVGNAIPSFTCSLWSRRR